MSGMNDLRAVGRRRRAGDASTRLLCVGVVACLLGGAQHVARGQTPVPAGPPVTPAAAPPAPEYHPSMGDLMTMAVQPRHTKLGLAGARKNWSYAAYELSELRNAFARIGRTIPKYQSIDAAAVLTAMTNAPLDALQQSITDASPTRFAAAYEQLTNACNSCHRSQNHEAVVIQVPKEAMYPDQNFRPVGQ